MPLEATFYSYCWIQIAWVIAAGAWFVRKRDELPLILSLFLFYVFTFRFWAFLQHLAVPANLAPFGFSQITFENCLDSDGLAILGETVLLGIYMAAQRRTMPIRRISVSPVLRRSLRNSTFLLALVCVPLALAARGFVGAQMNAGKSMAFEISSYFSLFPFVLISVGILTIAAWKIGALDEGWDKFVGATLLVAVAYLTFDSSARFQFLGWLLAATIIMTYGLPLGRKTLLGLIGVGAAVALFAVAGALRKTNDPEMELQEEAVNRFAFAADANMLDGFVLLRQIYPEALPYSYGSEHLEILTRPIPRAWWPGKPVGGYMNKLGLTSAQTGFTLGISPSLFGSFYQEGGVTGIIVLSAIYGLVIASLIRWTANIHPFGGLLIRAITCAAVVPLLRGGDLPGIYAWVGMAFWPCVFFFWRWRHELLVKPRSTGRWVSQSPPMPHMVQ